MCTIESEWGVSTHAINNKFLCVRLWKRTCFGRRVLLSSFFFFLLSSLLIQNRALIFFVGKSDVLGEPWGGAGKKIEKNVITEKMKEQKKKEEKKKKEKWKK